MTQHYSASTGGFYDSEIHAAWPADAVEISAQRRAELLEAQSAGKLIAVDADGQPTATDPPPPTDEHMRGLLSSAVQRLLDAAARARGYDSMAAAVSYADEPAVPRYQADGQALRAWRSVMWEHALVGIAVTPVPTADALLATLPPAPVLPS
jgi:hypothetical protein